MNRLAAILLVLAVALAGCSKDSPTSSPTTKQTSPVKDGQSAGDIEKLIREFTPASELPPANPCDAGSLDGFWVRDDISGNSGYLSGLWLDTDGDTTGVFSGSFSTAENGFRYFYGNVSGVLTTQIIATVFGVFYYDDPSLCPVCGAGHGGFKGFFIRDNEAGVGVMQGEFGWGLSPEDNNLPLTGTWTWYCPPVDATVE
ncbi:MAG: hypothetical protein KKA42_02705 [candidate division Zixibacteria bacterium]|nr:hypothetical protein [candidate division Zixibacteria bacterium]